MGTSGLAGQLATIAAMGGTELMGSLLRKIVLLHVILPAILTLIIPEWMHENGYIKPGI